MAPGFIIIMDNITEDNKLIAEFMGHKVFERPGGETYAHYLTVNEDWVPLYYLADAKFDSYWDWLMPVVEKIRTMNCEVQIEFMPECAAVQSGCSIIPQIQSKHLTKVECFGGPNVLGCVYTAVVLFIKHYNQHETDSQ